MPGRLFLAALAALLLAGPAAADVPAGASVGACGQVGTWLVPATGKTASPATVTAALARRAVVLLGEQHDNADHHRWQLQMLAALHAYRPDMAVGFEMFPRRVQPVLDRWAAGAIDAGQFLRDTDWETVWGFDSGLYMPLFHFVRQNRLAMVALNVDRSLISRVGKEGWAAIPAADRSGLSDPAPAGDAYLRFLAGVFADSHGRKAAAEAEKPDAPVTDAEFSKMRQNEDFKRFVQAQLTWDRAMAEAIAEARRKRPASLVVGILGQGHARFGYGVPHQLADLGIADVAVVLPEEPDEACKGLPAGLADAVFVVAPPPPVAEGPPKPRLGVMIERAEGGVRILQVVKGSVAEASSLAASDIVVSAAGRPIEKVAQLIAIVRRQAPGTWLPLTIRRGGKEIEVVAKFPPEAPAKPDKPK